jgi:hypothetical protein
MFKVFLQRKNEINEVEEILVGKTENPFHYSLDPSIFTEIDPTWEHGSSPVRIIYKKD